MQPWIVRTVAVSNLCSDPIPRHSLYVEHPEHIPCLTIFYGSYPVFYGLAPCFFVIQDPLTAIMQLPVKTRNRFRLWIAFAVVHNNADADPVIPFHHLYQFQFQDYNLFLKLSVTAQKLPGYLYFRQWYHLLLTPDLGRGLSPHRLASWLTRL